jgi:glycosyltransferase involved in cell wall biosynthesis
VSAFRKTAAAMSRPPRVLLLANYFPKPGNPVMGVWALCEAQAMMRAGLEISVVSPTPWVPRALARLPSRGGVLERARAWATCPPAHDWDGLRVRYPRWPIYHRGPHKPLTYRNPLPELELGWRAVRTELEHAVEESRADVLYAHGTALCGFAAAKLRRRFGLPFVTADFDFDEVADCARFPRRRRVYARVSAAGEAMIAVSTRMERDIRTLFPAARSQTVHLGADPLPAALWDVPRPPETEGRTVIFSAATFYGRKGIPLLIRAFAQVAGKHPGAVLRIAGDGPERGAVQRAVAETGIGERVQLLGLRPHREVLQEMVWADAFALFGWDEPFATVFVEAMSAGNAIACTDDGGVSDVLRDSVHGYAVPPRDVDAAARALDRLLADEPARVRMGREGKRLQEAELTWDARAARMASILEEALA